MWSNLQFPADLVTFTEEIVNRKLPILCSGVFQAGVADNKLRRAVKWYDTLQL